MKAAEVEAEAPLCACERFSVGLNSPGPVHDSEPLYRMVIGPGDVDQTGQLMLNAVRDVKLDGLSVFRESASDNDIIDLVSERLTRPATAPTRIVLKLLRVQTVDVRSLQTDHVGRLFCVYDETVPRSNTDLPQVPTHVTVLQRVCAANVHGRKGKDKEGQQKLYELLRVDQIDVDTFRDGIIARLNEKSVEGEFIKPDKTGE